MELLLPTPTIIPISAIVAFLTLFASVIGVYYRLSNQIATVREMVDKMTVRNKHADEETESVKKEQYAQKTTVAVMAEQMSFISKTLERVDRNVEALAHESKR